jgi:hypothetical protein
MQGDGGQPRVVVASAAEVASVRAAPGGEGVWLLSMPGAAGFLGASGFAAVLREGGAPLSQGVLDAGAAPGFAVAGLRAGFGAVVLDPGCAAFPALAAEAARRGVALWPARGEAVLAARWLRLSRAPAASPSCKPAGPS